MSAQELRAEFSRDGAFYYRGNKRITADEYFHAMELLVSMEQIDRYRGSKRTDLTEPGRTQP